MSRAELSSASGNGLWNILDFVISSFCHHHHHNNHKTAKLWEKPLYFSVFFKYFLAGIQQMNVNKVASVDLLTHCFSMETHFIIDSIDCMVQKEGQYLGFMCWLPNVFIHI